MNDLHADDFAEFHHAVHGVEPFHWQRDLLAEVSADRQWPDLIDLPTGTGKTSLLDIALFSLALDAGRPADDRWASRRIVLVVDRRVVVDQALRRAQLLRRKLREAGDGDAVLRTVADRLRSLFDGDPQDDPVVATVLRGGIVRDESWAHRPDIPAIVTSTVDQVGSRLLFRGYGVSHSMRPVHAGLLGADTLFLLDEVHLSRPFAQTLRSLRRYQRWAERDGPDRWHVVEMSATPRQGEARRFPAEPLQAATADAALRPVLAASKPVEDVSLVKVPSDSGKAGQVLAGKCADAALDLLQRDHVTAVGVVVNRVATACAVERQLAGKVPVRLLTGRMRPLDRDVLTSDLFDRLRPGRRRRADDEPVVVVATQCIEAGVDFDLDGLVTECASIDALRQRFGRLDRRGDLAAAGTPAPGRILVPSRDVASTDDPVYGPALANTWRWLSRQTGLDFGIEAFPEIDAGELKGMTAPSAPAPALLPMHLDSWVQTRPAPLVDPDVSLWLHGLRDTSTEVQVVWRADINRRMLQAALDSTESGGTATGRPSPIGELRDLLSACPPGGGEAMPVPRQAVLRWLGGDPPEPIADVEGAEPSAADPPVGDMRPVLCWRGDESRVTVDPDDIRPGDVLVVPSDYGGLAQQIIEGAGSEPGVRFGTWDPQSTVPVADLGDEVQWRQRRRAVVRLASPLWQGVDLPDPAARPEDLSRRDHLLGWLDGWLAEHRDDGTHLASVLGHLGEPRPARRLRVYEAGTEGERFYVMVGRDRLPSSLGGAELEAGALIDSVDTDDETSSFTAVEIPLDDHLQGVEGWARRFAESCGLGDDLADDLALAGRLHDLGKVDPRYQVMLHGGDEIAAVLSDDRPLAKSAVAMEDRQTRREAQRRSGYPPGMRHEVLSLALMTGSAAEQQAHDLDLVRHLVATHHGWCRPLVRPVRDPAPRPVKVELEGVVYEGTTDHGLERLDAGIPDRFWRLVRRYGWLRLAWLEALLRLADHRRSEEERQRRGGEAAEVGGS